MTQTPTAPRKENAFVRYFRDFNVLKETRKEYWGLQIVNALDCIAYFAMFNILVLTLSDDYGFTDASAGDIFGFFAAATTLFLFISGAVSDWLGIKKSLYLAMLGLLLTRAAAAGAAYMEPGEARNMVIIGAMVLMAPFMAMLQTVFQAANKRFTTKRSRGAGFNLWYLFMNVGAAGGGFLVDFMYLKLGLPRFHIYTFGVVVAVINIVVVALMIHRTEQLYGPDEEREPEVDPSAPRKSPWGIAAAVLTEKTFWRFTALITLLLGVRAVFLYLGGLAPKFWVRVIGEDAQIGLLQAINPVLVIIGLILLIPVLNRFSVYKMLVTGAIITSVSLLFMAVPPPAGADVADFTYMTTVAFLLLLTVGELIWSPRLQEYTAAIAPKGQEGTYLGLSMVPYFGAKIFVGFASGRMLERWCPEGIGEQLRNDVVPFWDSPYAMWLVLALIALGGSLGALALKGWFTKGTDLGAAPKRDVDGGAEPPADAAAA